MENQEKLRIVTMTEDTAYIGKPEGAGKVSNYVVCSVRELEREPFETSH